MAAGTQKDWKEEFGIDGRKPPNLFTSSNELTPATPQAHLLRRAFELLELDGVLCADHSPLVYFKTVKRISAEIAYQIHQQFWNHGGAPVLVLISDAEVHIYSGMSRPGERPPVNHDQLPSFIETLKRVAGALRTFLTAVESGEYFARHAKSFNPAQRVDRDLLDSLQATREKLGAPTRKRIPAKVLDALLCRLVFTCYLFDRGVIDKSYLEKLGIREADHLRDVLALKPQTAKSSLYKLFKKLGEDFNGDLFSDDLKEETEWVQDEHIKTLSQFFHGTNVRTGQGSFWPYDFECIPIETISAIYERFLKEEDEKLGAFYTPRFLAEVVLDIALSNTPTLLGKRALDPACGSGIFLVGLFNRIAEEWKQDNPKARNDTKARELMRLLQESLFGVDVKETACRIAAFSLYLAYLDQLAPRDIQALQEKGRFLPKLMGNEGNIRCADFFNKDAVCPSDVDIVIGNPPWGSIATANTPAGVWCTSHFKPLPDKQIAAAFVWKAVEHLKDDGHVCFVLPHGLIFNHSTTAVPFQKAWITSHTVTRIANLADLRFLLFEKAIHPAIVASYRKPAPSSTHTIEYWTPKGDWTVTKTEVITISPQDRTCISLGELLRDLNSPDAPQIWKQRYWATPRDWRLLDRLSQYPRLRDQVRQVREKETDKPWVIAQGFQPLGPGDKAEDSKLIDLPSIYYVDAGSEAFDLVLTPEDCKKLASKKVRVRGRSGVVIDIFRAPHVLVSRGFAKDGFSSCAYAGFDVSFRSSVRGIHGPEKDANLLIFLMAYLRSSIASYYLFHSSSSLGIYRPEVHDKDLLQLPFPLPSHLTNPARGWSIVKEVSSIVAKVTREIDEEPLARDRRIQDATKQIQPLVYEYFDILPTEAALIADTLTFILPSVQPTVSRMPVETVKPSSEIQLQAYCNRVCDVLNGWAKRGKYAVRGTTIGSTTLGVGLAAFEKVKRSDASTPMNGIGKDMLAALDSLRKAAPQKHNTLDLVRGVMAFSGNQLYMVKPIGQRQWTQTAAMNDADEIAGTILMRPLAEEA
jgi:N-6 DNA Methylase